MALQYTPRKQYCLKCWVSEMIWMAIRGPKPKNVGPWGTEKRRHQGASSGEVQAPSYLWAVHALFMTCPTHPARWNVPLRGGKTESSESSSRFWSTPSKNGTNFKGARLVFGPWNLPSMVRTFFPRLGGIGKSDWRCCSKVSQQTSIPLFTCKD